MNKLLLFIIFLAACGLPPDKKTATYKSKLENSSATSSLENVVQILEEESNEPFLSQGDYKITIEYADLEGDVIGLASPRLRHCRIRLDKSLIPDTKRFKLVLMHEIGHCFGLGHSKRRDDIMHHKYIDDFQGSRRSLERYIRRLKKVRKYE